MAPPGLRHAWVPESAIRDQRLGDAAFRVYCCLLSFADKTGHCNPRVGTIAKALGKARSTVSEHLSTIVSLGYANKYAAFRPDGGKAANEYWVARDGLADIPHVGSADMEGGTVMSSDQQSASPHQASFLLAIDGEAPPENSSRTMSVQPTCPAGPADIPCRPRTDMHKEQTKRTERKDSLSAREGDGMRCALDEYQPDAAIDDWAAQNVPELRNPRDPAIVAKFKAYHKAKGKYPVDCTAAFQLWLLREQEFAATRNGRPCSGRSPLMETLLKEAYSSAPTSSPLVPIRHRDAPGGSSWGGAAFEPDENGINWAPLEAVDVLIESHGYVGVPDGTMPHTAAGIGDDAQIANPPDEACIGR